MMLLSTAAKAIGAQQLGVDKTFTSVGTDSRHIVPGQLFVALKGAHFNGHAFVAEAIAKGAIAALVSESVATENVIVVKDTRLALGALAAYWRGQFSIPLVAVTGSNGKTTVKEMIAAILVAHTGNAHAVHATAGNLNNDIGLPITLLRLNAQHQFSVLEMGMNHAGEIRYLTHLAHPTVALINNAGTAHIGELGSQAAIAEAKGEVFEGLGAEGVAVVNADDAFSDYWRSLNRHRTVLSFGLTHTADITASYQLQETVTQICLKTPHGSVQFNLAVLGIHNVYNALAASAVAVALGIDHNTIAQGLSGFGGMKGRLNWLVGLHGAVVIDDTYNANPDSMRAAIDVLATQKNTQIFVMGDMGELGVNTKQMHAEIGSYAKKKGIAQLLTVGECSASAAQAFGSGASSFSSREALLDYLQPLLHKEVTVLVKGSRFMQMERVVQQITEINQPKEAVVCCSN